MLRTPIPVSAAVIERDGMILAYRRPASKARPLMYEFPGGKREEGETDEAALIRECREELGVTIAVQELFMELTHVYPDLTVHLTIFQAKIIEGTPQLLEHCDLRWISVAEIDDYKFCPADKEILCRLKNAQKQP